MAWSKHAAGCIALLSLSACASTGFVTSWKAPDARPLDIDGAKVAAVVMMRDGGSRRGAEDSLAREITARGVTGVPMYTILPDADPKNEPAARAALESAGFTGVVVMRPVGTTQEVVSTPVMYTAPMYGGYWGSYYPYGWGTPYGYVGTEVYTNTIVSIETLVYSFPQNKLVWGGQSKTTNPSSVDRLIKETVAAAAKELRKHGLVPK